MRKLNVKKLAAIGLGAALIGSALAPIASAQLSLQKDQIIKADGTSAVNIVVGASAAASDVVWAGNIAAKVAQLATTESAVEITGGTGSAAATVSGVDLTVGGTVKISGGAKDEKANMDSTSGVKEVVDSVGNAVFKNFKSSSYTTKIGGVSTSVTVNESVGVKADALFSTNPAIKDLVGLIAGSDINYVVTFSPSIDQMTDTNDATNVPISFLGENWLIDTISGTSTSISKVILVKSNAESTYSVGDKIPVTGVNGQTYMYSIVSGGTASGGTFSVTVELQDSNGTVVSKKTIASGSNLEDSFMDASANPLISTKVNVHAVTKTSTSPDVYIFGLIIGNDKIELQTGQRFPYDAAKVNETSPWLVTLTPDTGANTNKLASIKISNSTKVWDTTNPIYSDAYSFKAAGTGAREAGILDGSSVASIGRIKFRGFYDAGVSKSVIKFLKGNNVSDVTGVTTYGAIQFTDTDNVSHKLPMAILLASSNNPSFGTFKFGGQNYAFATNNSSAADGATAGNSFFLKKGGTTTADLRTSPDANFLWPTDTTIQGTSGDVNDFFGVGDINAASPIVTLTTSSSKNYRYVYKVATSGAWLVLAGRGDFNRGATGLTGGLNPTAADPIINAGYIDTLYQNTGALWFLGTDIDDGNRGVNTELSDYNVWTRGVNTASDMNVFKQNQTGVSYYAPDAESFGMQPGSVAGTFKTAIFKIKEIDSNSGSMAGNAATGVWTIYIDTENGNSGTVDTANYTKTNYTGKTVAADYNGYVSLNSLSESTASSSNYTKAYDDNGGLVELASREVTLTFPNSKMQAYFTIESNDTTTETTGGEALKAIPILGSGTTIAGTKITVDSVAATCPAGGGATASPDKYNRIVPVGQLVYLDSEVPSGSNIIIGGYLVNSFSKGIILADGTTIEDKLTASGDKAFEVLANGDIIVAGYTADDTVSAAKELISALDEIQ